MIRERTLQVFLALLGVFFCLGTYPIGMMLLHPDPGEDTGDAMMLSLYVTLGIFLLFAARKPAEHRSLIAFTAWSGFAHAAVMGTMVFQFESQQTGFLIASGVLVVIGIVLLALLPSKTTGEEGSPARELQAS
ncbi:MAG TPA: DUF6632 domain-containing protein [Candidatus Bathyarchaeia archaeon]|nr:DUF6632 domain-containing protein [Candidatus Bathyarchaeia archaeon]